MGKRLVAVYCILNLMFVAAVVRIGFIANDKTYKAAQTQSTVRLDIASSRGTVYDCNMQPLTNDKYVYIAAVPPTAQALSEISEYTLTEAQRARLKSGYPIALTVDQNFRSDYIKTFKIAKTSQPVLAPHIIGYLNSDNRGVCGIEQSYENILSGGTLSVRFKCDAHGNILAGETPVSDTDEYLDTGSVVLTIDKKIQSAAQTAAKKYLKKGAVVVLENSTAKIRAMVSVPDYSADDIESALKSTDAAMTNRAVSAFNCGSVFKICVAAAALESGISPNYTCTGNIKIASNTFNCLNISGHGKMTMKSALSLSCNTYFINLGQQLGGKKIYQMARSFGFGKSCELCGSIVSAAGNLPSLNDITSNAAALANFSFGQGDLMTTPLQIANMIQAVCNNGKLIKPTLVESTVSYGKKTEFSPPAPTYVMSEKTSALIREYMIGAVENGTGASAKPESGSAGGKTATAETGWTDNGREIVHAWFGGFFPADNPKYTVVVLAEDGVTGGKSAAPVFKYIADHI